MARSLPVTKRTDPLFAPLPSEPKPMVLLGMEGPKTYPLRPSGLTHYALRGRASQCQWFGWAWRGPRPINCDQAGVSAILDCGLSLIRRTLGDFGPSRAFGKKTASRARSCFLWVDRGRSRSTLLINQYLF